MGEILVQTSRKQLRHSASESTWLGCGWLMNLSQPVEEMHSRTPHTTSMPLTNRLTDCVKSGGKKDSHLPKQICSTMRSSLGEKTQHNNTAQHTYVQTRGETSGVF